MKATAARTLLAEEAKWCARVIDTRHPDDVTAGLTITATDNAQLVLDAMSYDGHHRARVPAEVGEGDRIVVPGLPFANLLGSLRGKDVSLETSGTELVIRAGTVEASFRTLPSSLDWARPESDQATQTDAEQLTDVAERLLPIVRRGTDPIDAGWQDALRLTTSAQPGDSDRLTVTAATRYAIGQAHIDALGHELDVLVPAKALAEALRGCSGTLGLQHTGGTLYLVEASGREAGLRTFDPTEYPRNVESLLEVRDPKAQFTIDREATLAALKLAGTVTDHVRLQFSADALVMETMTPTKGEARGTITETLNCAGDDQLEALAALEFLVPCLGAITDPAVDVKSRGKLQLHLSDETTRLVFQLRHPGG